jgi:hypothetical protein
MFIFGSSKIIIVMIFMERIPYPVESLPEHYLSPLGGFSAELGKWEIGISRRALLENTNIVPFVDEVILRKFEAPGYPLIFKRPFSVIPLTESTPEAKLKSKNGEVVLSEELIEKMPPYLKRIKIGDLLVISNISKVNLRESLRRILKRD